MDSCNTLESFVFVSFSPTSMSVEESSPTDFLFALICFDTAIFVMNIAKMKARGSRTARIAAMYPSEVTP